MDPQCKKCSAHLPPKHHGRLCRLCYNSKRKLEYRENEGRRNRQLNRQKIYTLKNWKMIYARNRAYSKKLLIKKPLAKAFYQARCRAKMKGIPFTIRYEDIPIPPIKCPILGIPIVYNSGKRHNNSPSLEKIQPHLGYVPGNVDIISFRANHLKNNGTISEFAAVINYMKKHGCRD